MEGCFITLEGGEGAGKSTLATYITDYLRQQGIEVLLTREPGGTEVGEAVRRILLDPELPAMHSDTELLLMFAARYEHLDKTILPALRQGQWVVCDRFTDATYAYQGGGRGLAMKRIAVLENWVQGELRPDATLLFDLPVEIGMQRAKQRSAADRFEQEQYAFFQRVRDAYLARQQLYPEQYYLIDAAQSLETVQMQLQSVLQQLMAAKGYTSP